MLDDHQLLAECIRVMNANPVAMMATVDAEGRPHARWMSSSTITDGVHRIFTLTDRNTRKIEQLEKNPHICWVYSADEFATIVTLHGEAKVLTSAATSQTVWDRLMVSAGAYVMSMMDDDAEAEFATIETEVKQVELVSPRLKIHKPRVIDVSK